MFDTYSLSDDELTAIPKAELHVHLEGSLSPATTLALAAKHRIEIGATTLDEVRDLYRFEDFKHFLQLYGELTFVLAEPEDFAAAVLAYGAELASQGCIYAELTLTLGTHVHFKSMDPSDVMSAAWQGAQLAQAHHGVTIRFILDHVRSFSLERCLETVRWCDQYRDLGVVGLGLAGPEDGWPCSVYAEALTLAANLEIPFVPHAGEETEADSIWDALQYRPRRIGHGLSAVNDEALLQQLIAQDVLVEVCLTSNVVLSHVRSYEDHPVRRLFEAGVAISLNSDDPPMFGTSLLNEYRLANSLGFSASELNDMTCAAIDHALVDESTKRGLLHRCGDIAGR